MSPLSPSSMDRRWKDAERLSNLPQDTELKPSIEGG